MLLYPNTAFKLHLGSGIMLAYCIEFPELKIPQLCHVGREFHWIHLTSVRVLWPFECNAYEDLLAYMHPVLMQDNDPHMIQWLDIMILCLNRGFLWIHFPTYTFWRCPGSTFWNKILYFIFTFQLFLSLNWCLAQIRIPQSAS